MQLGIDSGRIACWLVSKSALARSPSKPLAASKNWSKSNILPLLSTVCNATRLDKMLLRFDWPCYHRCGFGSWNVQVTTVQKYFRDIGSANHW